MPKIATEARHICPELTGAIKAFDYLARSRQYSEIFSDFIDWLVFQHMMPPAKKNPFEKYKKEEQNLFMEAFKNTKYLISGPSHFCFFTCSRSQLVGLPKRISQVFLGRLQISTNKSPQA